MLQVLLSLNVPTTTARNVESYAALHHQLMAYTLKTACFCGHKNRHKSSTFISLSISISYTHCIYKHTQTHTHTHTHTHARTHAHTNAHTHTHNSFCSISSSQCVSISLHLSHTYSLLLPLSFVLSHTLYFYVCLSARPLRPSLSLSLLYVLPLCPSFPVSPSFPHLSI